MQRFRRVVLASWIILVASALYLYFFHRESIQAELQQAFSVSLVLASAAYLGIGVLRAFTLVPSSFIVFAALPFFPPGLLFGLTLVNIAVSSTIIYWGSESLHLDELLLKGKHAGRVEKLRDLLQRRGLPIIIAYSFFPPAPTDLICYICGVLRINFAKFLLGIMPGEGAICAVYIFAGDSALRFFHLKP